MAEPAVQDPPQGLSESFDAKFQDDGLDDPQVTLPEPTKEPEPEPESEPAPAPKADKPKAEPETKPDTEPKADEFEPPKVAKPNELRSWAMRQGHKAKQLMAEVTTLKAEMAKLKSQPVQQGQNVQALTEELARTKEQAKQYAEQLKAISYQHDPEFQEKFSKPRQTQEQKILQLISRLKVYVPNPDDPENPQQRKATVGDFFRIYNAETETDAVEMADQMFGKLGTLVVTQANQLRDLSMAENDAAKEWAATAGQRDNARKAAATQNEQAMGRMFDQASKAYAEKNADLYLERQGDDEGNGLLKKAREFAISVFSGNEGLSPQQIAMRDARAFNWLSAYPRAMRDIKYLEAENKKLKNMVEGVKGSGPGKSIGGKTEPKTERESLMDAFNRAVPG